MHGQQNEKKYIYIFRYDDMGGSLRSGGMIVWRRACRCPVSSAGGC